VHPEQLLEPAVIGLSADPCTPNADICFVSRFDPHAGHFKASSSALLRIKSSNSFRHARQTYS